MSFSLVSAAPLTGLEMVFRILMAVIMGCLIGVEREHKNRPAGLRTHVLVGLGACVIALIECLFVSNMNESTNPHITYNFGRMAAQVISGIGFLGAGTIFMQQKRIAGLTTAASLWNIACLGLASGYGYYWISLIVCVLILVILTLLQRILPVNSYKCLEVRFIHRKETLQYINSFFEERGIKVLNLDFHIESRGDRSSNDPNVYTNFYTLHLPASLNYADVIGYLASYPNIQVVRVTNM